MDYKKCWKLQDIQILIITMHIQTSYPITTTRDTILNVEAVYKYQLVTITTQIYKKERPTNSPPTHYHNYFPVPPLTPPLVMDPKIFPQNSIPSPHWLEILENIQHIVFVHTIFWYLRLTSSFLQNTNSVIQWILLESESFAHLFKSPIEHKNHLLKFHQTRLHVNFLNRSSCPQGTKITYTQASCLNLLKACHSGCP